MFELRSREALALRFVNEWLANAIPLVDPFLGDSCDELAFRRKCLNELAFYALWLEYLGVPEDVHSAALKRGVGEYVSDDYIDLACRSPKRILMFSSALAYGMRAGVLSAARRERVTKVLAGSFAWYTEWPAFRQLDILAACKFAAARAPVEADDVLRVSSIHVLPCPIYSDRDAFYALTHTLFYAFILERRISVSHELLLAIDGALCRAVAMEDLDLALELMLGAMSAGVPQTPAMHLIAEDLLAGLSRQGVPLKASAIETAAVKAFTAVRPTERSWAESAHVMIVAALLLSTLCTLSACHWALPSQRDRLAVKTIGSSFAELHRYRIISGLQYLMGFDPQTDLEHSHIQRVIDFLLLNRSDGGRFGLYLEEKALLERANPAADFERSVRPPVDDACVRFLNKYRTAAYRGK